MINIDRTLISMKVKSAGTNIIITNNKSYAKINRWLQRQGIFNVVRYVSTMSDCSYRHGGV